MRLNKIELRNVLPSVFRDDPQSKGSQVWMTDLAFERGTTYLIEAESGAGKSSMCSFIYGNRSDYEGTILFNGTNIREFGIGEWSRLRRESLALLPQELRLFPELSALDNIMLKNRLTDCKSETEIRQMLEMLEIEGKADSLVAHLSVGQQQRVAIARALCQPFDFLLLDEPVSHLDSRNNAIAASLIGDEAAKREASIILTSVGNHLSLSNPKILKL